MVFPLKPRSCRLNVSNRRYTPENQRLDTQNDGLENDSPFWYLYVKFLACTLLWNNNCSASMIVLLGIHGWSIRYHPKGLLDSSHQHYQTYMISIFFNLISNLILYHIKPTRTSISRFISKHRGFLRIRKRHSRSHQPNCRRFGGFGDAFGGSGGSASGKTEAEKLRLEAEFSPGEAEIGNQYVC